MGASSSAPHAASNIAAVMIVSDRIVIEFPLVLTLARPAQAMPAVWALGSAHPYGVIRLTVCHITPTTSRQIETIGGGAGSR